MDIGENFSYEKIVTKKMFVECSYRGLPGFFPLYCPPFFCLLSERLPAPNTASASSACPWFINH